MCKLEDEHAVEAKTMEQRDGGADSGAPAKTKDSCDDMFPAALAEHSSPACHRRRQVWVKRYCTYLTYLVRVWTSSLAVEANAVLS